MSAPLCATCGQGPAVSLYRSARTGGMVVRALPDHDECRQCRKSAVDRDLARRAAQTMLLTTDGTVHT